MVAALPLHFPAVPGPPPRETPPRDLPDDPDQGDRRFAIYGISWAQYVAINDALGDRGAPRVCYCEGTLELMSPGLLHEDKKKTIARLVELYALARDVRLQGAGSLTYRNKPKERGAEPDECYFLDVAEEGRPPDLAIEVAVSRSAIDKLSLYAGLGVRELWIWRDNEIAVFSLGRHGYRQVKASKVLPGLDLAELTTFVRKDDQAAAAKAYWKRLQAKPSKRR
jgi:Uma2 family endonuclease